MHAYVRAADGTIYLSKVFGRFNPITARDDYEGYESVCGNLYYLVLDKNKEKLIRQYFLSYNLPTLKLQILIVDNDCSNWVFDDGGGDGCESFLSHLNHENIENEIDAELLKKCIRLDAEEHYAEFAEIKNQIDADNLTEVVGEFHDGLIKKIIMSKDGTLYVNMKGFWGCDLELWFSGNVTYNDRAEYKDVEVQWWNSGTILVEDGFIYLANGSIDSAAELDDEYIWFRAKSLKYHVIPTIGDDKNKAGGKKIFRFYKVKPKGVNRKYSYLCRKELEPGAFVEIPFGSDNEPWKGIVAEVGLYTAEDAPYPVENTKYITRTITAEEYGESKREARDFMDAEINLAESLLAAGDEEEIFNWAAEHHDAVDSPEIIEMVVKCYKYCLANNNPAAALNLGTLYYVGRGVEQDYAKAAKLYEIAAKAGEIRAICNLGYCYYYGRHQAVDYEKAYYYFNLGVQLEYDANCLYKLGDMYRDGKYVEKNIVYAEKLYQNAYDNSDEEEIDADISLRIGQMWLNSEIHEQNPEVALKFLQDALLGFYQRRKTDPFAGGLIKKTKKLISEAMARLDDEMSWRSE